jgi:hypothetical protein
MGIRRCVSKTPPRCRSVYVLGLLSERFSAQLRLAHRSHLGDGASGRKMPNRHCRYGRAQNQRGASDHTIVWAEFAD